MIVAVLAFLGGALTIFSPCILPVLPFVFARTEQPFARSTLPLLIGMAATFARISTLAAVGGAWAVHLNDYGRVAGAGAAGPERVGAAFAALRRLGHAAVGGLRRAPESEQARPRGVASSLLLGVATGLPLGAMRRARSSA